MTFARPLFISPDNKHTPACGKPGTTIGSEWRFSSYWENEQGEQWIATVAGNDKKLTVRAGGLGWDRLYQFNGKHLKDLQDNLIVIGKAETLWLQACYSVLVYRLKAAGRE